MALRSSSSAERLRLLRQWFTSPLGIRLANVEQIKLNDILSDLFGYHLVVVDPPCMPESLGASRIHHRVVQSSTVDGIEGVTDMLGGAEALPFCTDSIDAFVLPHTLEIATQPHQVLREIDRCLVAEGHLVVLGFNPFGWWGMRKLLTGWYGQVPWSLRFVSLLRLKDWLSLLGFDTIQSTYLFPQPPWQAGSVSARIKFLNQIHQPNWPPLAASYVLLAKKRVTTLTPVKPRWRPRRAILAGSITETSRGSVRSHGRNGNFY